MTRVRQTFGSLGRDAAIYAVGNVLSAAVPVLLLPVLTRRLTVDAYGILGMFDLVVGLVLPIVGLNLQGAIARQYYERDTIDFPAYVGTCLIMTAGMLLVGGIGLAGLHSTITQYTGIPGPWIGWVLATAFGQFLVQASLTIWQVREQPLRFGAFRVSQAAINITLSLALVLVMDLSWRGRVLGQSISFSLFGVAGIVGMWSAGWIRFTWVSTYARNAMRFGLPLIPHTIGFWTIMMIDRLFVSVMLGAADVGRYTAAYQIGMGVSLLQTSFNQAWAPWLYGRLKEGTHESRHMIVRFTYGYFGAMLLLAALLALAAPIIGRVVLGGAFQESIGIIGWIGLGYAFNGMYKMVTNYMFFAEKTYVLAWITFGTAICGAGLNYVLIKANGLTGAAQASCATFLLSFLATWVIAHGVFPMPWRLRP